jgi:uncharacterized membrane protein
MTNFLAGLAVFFAVHLVPTRPNVRRTLVDRLGDGGYKIAFAIASLIGLVIIVVSWQSARGEAGELWDPPTWSRHLAFLLMLPAFVLLAAAYTPSRIGTLAKHPMLAAIKVWAFSHLIANGDSASMLLFGSFLVYAVYDRISLRRREAMGLSTPRSGGTLAGDMAAVVIGAVAWAAMLLVGHEYLIGVPLIGPIAIPS